MQDVYQRVTDQIVAQLENGVRPWAKSWRTNGQRSVMPIRWNGETYNGVNVVLLWGEQMAKGYTQRRWMTFNQARELGACVRKGEKGSLVVYANRITRTEENDAGEEVERSIPFMKAYTVFNVEQIDGLPAQYFETVEELAPSGAAEIEHAEAFFRKQCADVQIKGDVACFSPALDVIRVPPISAFVDAEAYYGTLAHEFVHWTGHESRLNRDLANRFGSEAYAAEELIAEMGAAFVCAMLGLEAEPREDHASYLAGWLKVLKSDKRAIFTAATQAQRAADYLAERSGLKAPKVVELPTARPVEGQAAARQAPAQGDLFAVA